ncbi:MAG: hypothetical protein MUC84_03890, partial [Solirubrobacteraceae bacterium]|nr:hypothetical protein [Solirubrobacteraceae bacterium]
MPPEPPSARRISPDLQGEPAANHRPQRPHAPARRILPDEPGGSVTRERERALAALAARQHGRVSRAQLLDLGLTKAAIDGRLAQHRLQRVYGGVYAVGYTSSEDRGRLWAAWLACAPDAAISHQSAAAAWGLWRDRG